MYWTHTSSLTGTAVRYLTAFEIKLAPISRGEKGNVTLNDILKNHVMSQTVQLPFAAWMEIIHFK